MPYFEDYPHRISTIDTAYIRPLLAACHLLIENQHAAFIDVGTSHSVDNLLGVLAEKQIAVENVDYIIVTHVHLDHAGGAGKMMALCPNAQLVVHPRGARHMIDPSKLWTGTVEVYGETKARELYGELLPVDAHRVIEAADNFQLTLQGRVLKFLDTAGHARHHFCVWDAVSQSFFSGDTFGVAYRALHANQNRFVFPSTTPTQFEPEALIQSIDRLLSYTPQQIFLTHYGRIDDLEAKAIQLKRQIHAYVDIVQTIAAKYSDKAMRLEAIVMALMYLTQKELMAYGCVVEEKEIEWIEMDMQLNAQGLMVWLERQATVMAKY